MFLHTETCSTESTEFLQVGNFLERQLGRAIRQYKCSTILQLLNKPCCKLKKRQQKYGKKSCLSFYGLHTVLGDITVSRAHTHICDHWPFNTNKLLTLWSFHDLDFFILLSIFHNKLAHKRQGNGLVVQAIAPFLLPTSHSSLPFHSKFLSQSM